MTDTDATLTVTDWEDNSEEEFTTPVEDLELKGCNKIQALGGVHTYLKRYLYLNALEIVENDMFDGNVGKPEIKPDDTDIYIGLSETTDTKSAFKYFNEYKTKVNNREAFTQAWHDHIKTFKEDK